MDADRISRTGNEPLPRRWVVVNILSILESRWFSQTPRSSRELALTLLAKDAAPLKRSGDRLGYSRIDEERMVLVGLGSGEENDRASAQVNNNPGSTRETRIG